MTRVVAIVACSSEAELLLQSFAHWPLTLPAVGAVEPTNVLPGRTCPK
jgi:hypothetical protein